MLFEPNSRIEKNDNGVRFYEQDIIFSDYLFEGDAEVDLTIDYLHPGFGVVLAEKYKGGPRNSEKAHLFKLGNNAFYVFEKTLLTQALRKENACLFAPGTKNKKANIIFRLAGKNIDLLLKKTNAITKKIEFENLGSYKLQKKLNQYYIGFYSNKGNIIRSVKYLQGTPKNWDTNIQNTSGGRISFIKDGFRFEKCIHDAEIEQDGIELNPGTYYVSYDKENVNGMNDIKCFVFPSKAKAKEDKYFEDDYKNIVKNGKFVIKEKQAVNVKFQGTNGLIKNIAIKDDPESAFVETYDNGLTIEGSYIQISLKGLSKVQWAGTIKSTPAFTDYTKPCPYAVVETVGKKVSLDDMNLKIGKEYNYEYVVKSNEARALTGKNEVGTYRMPMAAADKETIKIFHNMNATITKLILIDKDGKALDVIKQKTFKRYVPSEINGPILIKDSSGEPLDISSSYREVAEPEYRIDLFQGNYEMALKDKPVDSNVEVYGIPFGVVVNPSETEISKYAPQYKKISMSQYEVVGRVIQMNDYVRKQYKAIAVRYQSAEKFHYLFTNFERETFTDEPRILLSKPMADVSGGIIVYGCKKDIDLDYINRIPADAMVNSIDLCCGEYDMIPERELEIDYEDQEITLRRGLREQYSSIIVDYLKRDSYAINYREDMSQYEVDISMESQYAYLSYDMKDDGTVDNRKQTVIRPDRNKFIILRRKAGAFE